MEKTAHHCLITALIFGTLVLCSSTPLPEQDYKIEAFRRDGDSPVLFLRIQPKNNEEILATNRQGRQEDEDEDESSATAVQSTTPFIPAVLPALTKIFTGIITGNLNEIFHGSTSFAPQNISYAIDTVYNQVVGLPAPVSTQPPTRAPPVTTTETPPAPPRSPETPVVQATPPSSPAVSSIQAGQPLQGQSLIITTSTAATTTSKPTSNEDDEDESDADTFGFGRLRKGSYNKF